MSIDAMAEVVERLAISNVLLAIPSASRARKDAILLAADALGLKCYEFWVASSLRRVTVDEDGAGNRRLMTSELPMLVSEDTSALMGS